ncbi:MAG: 5-(carboxyamino)imidazole ribonucleotide mutase [Cytophagales bacterium]|nr:5-(carboxyamino)imidazole ribonucleotide mutase [Marinoscillum sp.]OUX27037.1 MAG: 5-(carboxyamino)imidazole ribonucleotide mutase [Flammeovirgaceae bacterium TMED262]PDH45404.1 MAG: 5-(carboxyamino)imidazole ribonucleotide mutase [Rhodothermaeota bacterium MED-G18]|tara:strand:+ start:123 stop:602 length:480 start_codon:yes stop_codon:yes gene_type:complete
MNKVGVIMGSKSDFSVMEKAVNILKELEVAYEVHVVSAHRTPDKMMDYSKNASANGIGVIIAGAGGAAHLPGMVASNTNLPVIGVPIKSRNSIDGWDSILSILQMPSGVPVATVALDGAKNAGILAAQILGVNNSKIAENLKKFKISLSEKVIKDDSTL